MCLVITSRFLFRTEDRQFFFFGGGGIREIQGDEKNCGSCLRSNTKMCFMMACSCFIHGTKILDLFF